MRALFSSQPISLRLTAASLNYVAKRWTIWRRPLGEAHPDFAENLNNSICMSDNVHSDKLSY